MKRLSALCLLLSVLWFSGCMNQPLPKDAYIKGVHSKIVTPWGTSEQIIDEAATGTAARNASLPEKK